MSEWTVYLFAKLRALHLSSYNRQISYSDINMATMLSDTPPDTITVDLGQES